MTTAKQSARELIDRMPEEASWDDIMYELYVKQKIESGIQDVSEGRVAAHLVNKNEKSRSIELVRLQRRLRPAINEQCELLDEGSSFSDEHRSF